MVTENFERAIEHLRKAKEGSEYGNMKREDIEMHIDQAITYVEMGIEDDL